jgi:hypothetical protein
LFSILGSVVLIALLVFFIRRRKLLEEYSILWLIIFSIFLIVSIFGAFLENFSRFLGVLYPPAALFVIMIIGIFLLMLHFSIIISDLKRKINRLSITNALLEERIKSLEKQG